jgi:SAM-dependent methyltransferase
MTASDRYVHALGYRWLNRLYDPLIRVTMAERRFKEQLIEQAGVSPSMRILDMGCGTGTLLLLMARRGIPHAVGLDGDLDILTIARGKRERTGSVFDLIAGLSRAIPASGGTFDRVFSTLMLHHLDDAAKRDTLTEVRRILRGGGELHIADWGRPHTPAMRMAAGLVSAFDGAEVTRANLEGRIPDLCRQAGFSEVELRSERRTVFGTLAFYCARKASVE